MKERLVELINQSDKAFADKYAGKVMLHIDELYEFVADYLIANGVIVPSEDYAKIVRCSECENLKVIGTKEIYAKCEKYGFEFLPFKADTRNHFCVQYK